MSKTPTETPTEPMTEAPAEETTEPTPLRPNGEAPAEPASESEQPQTPERWLRCAYGPDGSVGIEWTRNLGPVDLLGIAGYIEWQARMMLDREQQARDLMSRRIALPTDHLGPGGVPRSRS